MKQYTKVLLVFAASLLTTSCVKAQTNPDNIALHQPVTFNTAPNYSYSTDPEDNIQLTDGKYTKEDSRELEQSRSMWVQKGTVGWSNRNPVVITIDLGKMQPISGASFNTAAGTAGVRLPTSIQMAVSDDGESWHYVGDLILMSNQKQVPPSYDDGYTEWRYVTHNLHTKGRYITFGVTANQYVFSDEIEVYRGEDAWLNQPFGGRNISSIAEYATKMGVTSAAQWRILDDAGQIEAVIKTSKLSDAQKSTFINRLQKDIDNAQNMEALPNDFRTIIPINDIHRDVLAVRGEFLAQQGLKPLTAWAQPHYKWLPLLAQPDENASPKLQISMLKNQFRSDSFLLTNASGQATDVTLQLNNAPANAKENWLQVYSVAWTDTAQGTPVADALIPAQAQNGVYKIDIPAGMTRKIWLTVDSSKLNSGIYKSTFSVAGKNQHFTVPFDINVSTVAMNTPRFSLGMWDYSDGGYAITEANRAESIALMRSHFINTAWAKRTILPWPTAAAFDANNALKEKLDFSKFDQWISWWPGNKNFFVYANVGKSFAGASEGTPEFDARVGSWAKVLSAHMRELNLQPDQLGICLVDEAHTEAQEITLAAWGKAIKAAAPELTLFSDPNAPRIVNLKNQDSVTTMDIICPTLTHYYQGGKKMKDYFHKLRADGKQLWFYQATGPVRLFSPQRYYRYQAWSAFQEGATGQGFWSFSDTSKAPSSFSEYGTSRINYAPAFFDGDKTYVSIHWDAVREGMEDNEELAMLQDKINKSSDATWKKNAQKTLDDAVQAVTSVWKWGDADWQNDKDPNLADTQLQKVREMLK